MCEKKFTRFRTNMYEGIKSKIINKHEKRDLIFYVWHRLVNLASIVNDEGYLYITKSMPYTVSTFAIEFDRNEDDIKTALNLLCALEMIEFTENGIYKVKSWSIYQNGRKENNTEYDADNKNKAENVENKITKKSNEDISKSIINKEENNLKDTKKLNINKKCEKESISIVNDADIKNINNQIVLNKEIEKNLKETTTKKSNRKKKSEGKIRKSRKHKPKSDELALGTETEEYKPLIEFSETYVMKENERLVNEFNFINT